MVPQSQQLLHAICESHAWLLEVVTETPWRMLLSIPDMWLKGSDKDAGGAEAVGDR